MRIQRSRRVWFLAALAAFILFAIVTASFLSKEPGPMDLAILGTTARLRFSFLNNLLLALTFLGSTPLILIQAFIVSVLLASARDRMSMLQLTLSSFGAIVMTELLKRFFARERPTLVPVLMKATGYSYPSGHSLAIAATYVTLAIIAWSYASSPRQRILAVTSAAAVIAVVAFSRVYIGVHYPSDTVSGILLGTTWALLVAGILNIG